MTSILRMTLCLSLLTGFAAACGDDGGDKGEAAALTAPSNLKATTVDGKPHLTWGDAQGEEHYMIERMDHSAGTSWAVVKDGEELVPNSNQFHDSSAQSGTTYMYRVVAMQGDKRAASNEVTWP